MMSLENMLLLQVFNEKSLFTLKKVTKMSEKTLTTGMQANDFNLAIFFNKFCFFS